MADTITPLILCGGSGTRLWPLSRKGFPKQFTPLGGDESLFVQAARRLSGPGYAPPVVVTGSDFRFIVTEQLEQAGLTPGPILIEPAARNTAPAILAGVLHIAATDPQALVLVAPSDHLVPDAAAFRAAVTAGIQPARAGRIVTFGIRPTRPETGYGWLELAEDPGDFAPRPLGLKRFVEKPDAARAADMLASGRHVWNAGIFLFTAATFVAAVQAHAPDLLAPVRAAVDGATPDLSFLRLDPGPWAATPDISVDYAVMERTPDLSVVPFTAGWSDLGDWDAVWRETGGASHGPVTAIDCKGTLLRSESDGLELVAIGLTDMVAVAMPDAVLIAPRARAQEVKQAVALLKARGAKQAETFPRDHRPWGWFETLALGDRFQVKRIVVHPGAALSLQSHMHRAEHWVVVQGTARVTVDAEVRLVSENQSVYIPLGAKHRMENPGRVELVLIEVQTGTYLGEDDITRYEDVYARGQGAKG
ncbi:MAG: mannose-1-phosphate guanylyltransferase/mannose-6-phosphate isomerase [Gemmobacter sp.]